MPITHLFWPADRKLFRQRSRWRGIAPALVVVALVVLVAALAQFGGGP